MKSYVVPLLYALALVVAALAFSVPVSSASIASSGTGADIAIPRVESWIADDSAEGWTLGSSSRIVVDSATAIMSTTGPDGPMVVSRTLRQTADAFAVDLRHVTGRSVPVVVGGTPGGGGGRLRVQVTSRLRLKPTPNLATRGTASPSDVS